jgi:NAD(P)-dependent dehydrogenase (short-subunit alcohol dehydrogenase family)
MKKLDNKVALVTGASRGIGASLAKLLAKEGAQTVLLARTGEALEKLDDEIRAAGGLPPILVAADLAQTEKLDALGAGLLERFGYLDIFVGNAAMLGDLGPMTHTKPKQWEKVVDVNLTANWRLLRILDPLLQRAQAGRALFVTSGVTQMALPFWGAYSVTKAALEKMVEIYAAENAQTSVKANLIDPGVVRTQMRATAMPGEDEATLPHPDEVVPEFLPYLLPDCDASGQRFTIS